MIEVNGSIDALLSSPEMFFEVANELSSSLTKYLVDDDTQLASVVKSLFDVVCSFTFTTVNYNNVMEFLQVMKSYEIQFFSIFRPEKSKLHKSYK